MLFRKIILFLIRITRNSRARIRTHKHIHTHKHTHTHTHFLCGKCSVLQRQSKCSATLLVCWTS